jgi:hypothetical protein
MEFLKVIEFWIVIFLTALFYILFFVSGYINVSWNMKLKRYAGYGIVLYIIFFFAQFGLKAGISSIIFLVIWGFIATPIIKYVTRKLNPEAYAAFNILKGNSSFKKFSSSEEYIGDLQDESEKKMLSLQKLQQDSRLLSILKKYGKPASEIETIYQILLSCGTNSYVAYNVVSNPKHLNNFLELKSKGISDLDAAFKLASSV